MRAGLTFPKIDDFRVAIALAGLRSVRSQEGRLGATSSVEPSSASNAPWNHTRLQRPNARLARGRCPWPQAPWGGPTPDVVVFVDGAHQATVPRAKEARVNNDGPVHLDATGAVGEVDAAGVAAKIELESAHHDALAGVEAARQDGKSELETHADGLEARVTSAVEERLQQALSDIAEKLQAALHEVEEAKTHAMHEIDGHKQQALTVIESASSQAKHEIDQAVEHAKTEIQHAAEEAKSGVNQAGDHHAGLIPELIGSLIPGKIDDVLLQHAWPQIEQFIASKAGGS